MSHEMTVTASSHLGIQTQVKLQEETKHQLTESIASPVRRRRRRRMCCWMKAMSELTHW